jgi:hypothetical protein
MGQEGYSAKHIRRYTIVEWREKDGEKMVDEGLNNTSIQED